VENVKTENNENSSSLADANTDNTDSNLAPIGDESNSQNVIESYKHLSIYISRQMMIPQDFRPLYIWNGEIPKEREKGILVR